MIGDSPIHEISTGEQSKSLRIYVDTVERPLKAPNPIPNTPNNNQNTLCLIKIFKASNVSSFSASAVKLQNVFFIKLIKCCIITLEVCLVYFSKKLYSKLP